MLPAPAASAGWYPDPAGRHELRSWSGIAWTEHIADQGQSSVDRLVVAAVEGPNVPADWVARRLWLKWDHPANAIRGESHHQNGISTLPGVTPGLVDEIRFEPVEVELVREPDNAYDRIACRAVVAGYLIGHLARECAAVRAPQVDAAGVPAWTVSGAVVGGSPGAEMYGVHVWLDRRLTVGPLLPQCPPIPERRSVTSVHNLVGDVLRGGDRGYLHCTAEEFVAAVDHQCPDCRAAALQPCRTVQGNVSHVIHSSRLELGERAIEKETTARPQPDDDVPGMRDRESADRYHKRTGRFPPHWTGYRRRHQEALFEEAHSNRNRQYLNRRGVT